MGELACLEDPFRDMVTCDLAVLVRYHYAEWHRGQPAAVAREVTARRNDA